MLRTLSAAFVALLVAGCATASAPHFQPSPLLSATEVPQPAQRCNLLDEPVTLPAAADLIDAPEAQRIIAANAAEGAAPPYVVLEVRFDSLGVLDHPRVLESNLPERARTALAGAVSTRAPVVAEDHLPWGVLLRVEADGNGTPAFRVGRMEWCRCWLANRREVTELLGGVVRNIHNPMLAGRDVSLRVEVLSDTSGHVVQARLSEPSRYDEVNEIMAYLIPRMKVIPGMLNRHPIGMWSAMPVHFVFPARSVRSLTPAEH